MLDAITLLNQLNYEKDRNKSLQKKVLKISILYILLMSTVEKSYCNVLILFVFLFFYEQLHESEQEQILLVNMIVEEKKRAAEEEERLKKKLTVRKSIFTFVNKFL